MNSMKHFFEYVVYTSCGISKVKLLGVLPDWIELRDAVKKLETYEFGWWTDNVVEIIDKIIETYEGNPDKDFWKYIYKYYGSNGSGT